MRRYWTTIQILGMLVQWTNRSQMLELVSPSPRTHDEQAGQVLTLPPRPRRRPRLRRRNEAANQSRPQQQYHLRREIQDLRVRQRHRVLILPHRTRPRHDTRASRKNPQYRDREGAVFASCQIALQYVGGRCHQERDQQLLYQEPEGEADGSGKYRGSYAED